MYPKFIEVHDTEGVPFQVNVEHIVMIFEDRIGVSTGPLFKVKESYAELSKLITDAGCNITRKDPRVDPEPLTMEDLKGMLGQPVWSVYHQQWFLANECDETLGIIGLTNYKMEDVGMTTADLIHYPLYRMKVNA